MTYIKCNQHLSSTLFATKLSWNESSKVDPKSSRPKSNIDLLKSLQTFPDDH